MTKTISFCFLSVWIFLNICACANANRQGSHAIHSPEKKTSYDCFSCANAPEGTIFCDDFEDPSPLLERYFEHTNPTAFVRTENAGRNGSAGMKATFDTGTVEAGNLKKSIGRHLDPMMQEKSSHPDKNFTEIYWRVDVRYSPGFKGGTGEKLTRATTMLDGWKQGMIAHIWSNRDKRYLLIDPASGIDTLGNVVSRKYNDFEKLRWLGAGTESRFDWFSPENDGKWHCVIGHAKLNTPGKSDGLFEFWINDELQARRENLNWHGTYNADVENYGINAVFFENYWNKPGSPVKQERYMDNILISTKPLKCGCN